MLLELLTILEPLINVVARVEVLHRTINLMVEARRRHITCLLVVSQALFKVVKPQALHLRVFVANLTQCTRRPCHIFR